MRFLMGRENALLSGLFVASKPTAPAATRHQLSLWTGRARRLSFNHGTSAKLQRSTSLSSSSSSSSSSLDAHNQSRDQTSRSTNVLGQQQNKFTSLPSSRQRTGNKFVQAPMLVRNINNYLAAVHRGLFGVSSQTVRQITMDTSEKLVHSRCNKQIEIKACGRLYSELVKSSPILFSGAPKDEGIVFKVDYYDSIDMISCHLQEAPTVCLLHGAPGHYEDFASLINSLTIRGIRVVAPNFPDYNATYQYSFRHSPRERLDFLLEFFRAIKVNKIDMLIGHSGAVYTMFELLEHSLSEDLTKWATTSRDFRVELKSLGLFSTPSHSLPRNLAVTPFRLFSLKLFDYALLRPLILVSISWWVKLQGIKNRVDRNKIEDLLIAASTVGYSEHNKMAARLDLLKRHQIPALLVYGTSDRLINISKFEELQKDLGVTDQASVKSYRSDGTLERDRSLSDLSKQLVDVSRFQDGGHYVFQRYSSQVNEDVYEFLKNRGLLGGGHTGEAPGQQEATRL